MKRTVDKFRRCASKGIGGRCAKYHGHAGFHEHDAWYDLPANHPYEQRRRAKHIARLIKQGMRVFRLLKPTGEMFYASGFDMPRDVVIGHRWKRKTLMEVPLHDLWPNTYK